MDYFSHKLPVSFAVDLIEALLYSNGSAVYESQTTPVISFCEKKDPGKEKNKDDRKNLISLLNLFLLSIPLVKCNYK
jgi:hypothetical protein